MITEVKKIAKRIGNFSKILNFFPAIARISVKKNGFLFQEQERELEAKTGYSKSMVREFGPR